MNCQIQGLSIHAEVHGTAEPALVFLHYWGGTSRTWRKVTAELEGQFKTVAYDARGWGGSPTDFSWLQTGRPCGRSSLTGQSAGNRTICPGWTFDGRQGRAARRIAEARGAFRPRSSGSRSANASRNPEEMRQGQLHAYDNRENVLKTIDSGRLTARPPSPETLEQIVEDSMSGSREATMAYPMESILEDISAKVANINVPTVLLAGELD